ncbi:MAG: transcription-repair coupling factor [Bacteriovoracales bacterium]|nr:transcription-repair coupling factor [Bacteriovoracales bacterium]
MGEILRDERRRDGESKKSIHLRGLEDSQWIFIQNEMGLGTPDAHHLLIFDSQEKAEYHHGQFRESLGGKGLFYPSLDASPYGAHIHSDCSLVERFAILSSLAASSGPFVIFTSLDAALLLMPSPSFFVEYEINLAVSDIISPEDLAKRLLSIGFRPTDSVEEPATFCRKGEIFDLYPVQGPPLRIHYFDDMIEEIFSIDPQTQRTQRDSSHETISLAPAPSIFNSSSFPSRLRARLPRFGPHQKVKESARKNILSKLSEGNLFESYSLYCPLFLSEQSYLFDYLSPEQDLIHFFNSDESEKGLANLMEELEKEYEDTSSNNENDCILPHPNSLYDFRYREEKQNSAIWTRFKNIHIDPSHLTPLDLESPYENEINESEEEKLIHFHFEPSVSYLRKTYPEILTGSANLKTVIQSLLQCAKENKKILIVLASWTQSSSKKEIENMLHLLLESDGESVLPSNIEFYEGYLESGFHYPIENLLVFSESDFFNTKKKRASRQKIVKNPDLFAEQLSSLKMNDYVIHKEYGIGVYKGLKTMSFGENKNDFLVIHYKDEDKLYVPVYRMDLVQKYADSSMATKIAGLKNNKFNQIKKRAKESAKKLAFDLLKIQAEREGQNGYRFSPPGSLFREFELKFPFQETNDQISAIEDILSDMQRSRPMDRLICGDVGFGKTEVAMRAAFKAVEDGMQVAIIVPTTILALQHYHSLQKRFEHFPVEIDFLSRFRTNKETKLLMEKAQSGKIDILIGTHKLLSNKLIFKNLGLLIIDEEQRFGVSHKEKLKSIRASIHVLTLTATPIPRTLQLAFLGLRELSLIRTAPPKRQSIKTYIIKHDDETVKKAIQSELKRGGQIFYVHNRVQSIDKTAQYIKDLIPSLKMVTAHGQMPEKELENKISDFYNRRYDLLLSTTIIESGLDIPLANTMIIERADSYGLAQLHQLRGRIGRSERKAYAYFLVPNDRNVSQTASQRLKALQVYADIGQGFSIASSDLEIRGAGDILGAEQSGHLDAVGLEVYMELLKEAIHELKGEESAPRQNIEIQTPFSCFIPNSYITDDKERLKTYKRLANLEDLDSLESIKEELQERFGVMPLELRQLFELFSIRIVLLPAGIEALKVVGACIEMKFSEPFLNQREKYRDQVVQFFISRPRQYKLGKDYSVTRVFSSTITLEKLSQFSRDIAQQIIPC